jgi:hypothetical protein
MAEEIKTTKSASDPSFVCPLEHGMSEEEAAQLRQAQEEAEENKNEVMFAKKEIEDLKRELWEARREKQKLESEGPEDVAVLEAQVEELRGVNEDLDLENKKLQEEIGQKDDEIVALFLYCILTIGSPSRSVGGGEEEVGGNGVSSRSRRRRRRTSPTNGRISPRNPVPHKGSLSNPVLAHNRKSPTWNLNYNTRATNSPLKRISSSRWPQNTNKPLKKSKVISINCN